jgi:hypothetical protein
LTAPEIASKGESGQAKQREKTTLSRALPIAPTLGVGSRYS